ncbi:multicopper oxidase family protein [Acaryochloris sp. CCMEE 5410]|uniref:multicopper oxidase family protein n=1 Tax=Acaryochloris sp. CCMEE 5410 TaxID=310037 RepID=UPI001F19EB8E|nr:multicopper oxidase family protein [Acaryochloris sp. CCMEE 5410]
MKRRKFLYLAAAASITPLLAQCNRRRSSLPLKSFPRFSSTSGLLDLSLTAQHSTDIKIGKQFAKRMTYNGHSPGPILEVQAGDTIRLTMANELGEPTNLHYHGLHISPEIDNVFREVSSGEAYTYEFQIPSNHPAVTGWYHPHYHLKVASQIFNGLAGPLIVRGKLDEIPEVQQAKEEVLVLQDFEPNFPDDEALSTLAKRWGREGSIQLVNGQQNPIIDLPQNGLLRLRLINASASRIYQLKLLEHPWFLIATDRGAIAEPQEIETLLLSPGERADLLIPGQIEPGDYGLLSLPYDRGLAEMIQGIGNHAKQVPGVALPAETTIATLRYVEGNRTSPLPLPKALIPVDRLPNPSTTREFLLNHGIDTTAGSNSFIINGQSFVMDRVNTQVQLNQVEDWHIINKASVDHPFHLHTNRFQVIERNGKPEPLLAWKDTVSVGGYESVKIRVRFEDYTGRTVYHCHILDHEDQGMMGIVEIV